MRIALISDIHANLPALEAVLSDIEKRNVDAIYCLGDLVSYAPWPNEVIEIIRKKKIPTIAGNHDEILGRKSNNRTEYKPDISLSIGQQSIEYTNSILSEDNRLYLSSLPKHLRLEFTFGNILLVHGSAEKIDEYLTEIISDEHYWNMMEKQNAQVMCFGHTHKPFKKNIRMEREDDKNLKLAINTGSVGKPKDGDPRAGYVIVSIPGAVDASSLKVEFRKVIYDVEEAAKKIEKSPLPFQFADMLRKAY